MEHAPGPARGAPRLSALSFFCGAPGIAVAGDGSWLAQAGRVRT